MMVIESRTFRELVDRAGASIADSEFRRCVFRHCLVSGESAEYRPRIRNVVAIGCEEFNSRVSEAVIEDVTVDGLRVNDLFIVSDCAFKHVVLKGKMSRLKITSGFAGRAKKLPKLQAELDAANEQFYKNVDWALDISNAEFEDFSISGVPLPLIRRDPETQVIFPAAVALGQEWRGIPEFTKAWGPRINALLKVGRGPELLLVAAKSHGDFRIELDGLNALRRAGLVTNA
jgi:hypothetical protein